MRATDAVGRGSTELDTYPLGFCTDYVTTAAAFLSYFAWDQDRVKTALSGSPVPVTVIYGEKDDLVERAWLDSLQGNNVTVRGVPGAGHFFDLAHEFDLLDEVVDVITEADHG